MSGLSEDEIIIYEQFSDEQYARQIQLQATTLLARNSRFVKDVDKLRKKHQIDGGQKNTVSLDQKAKAAVEEEIERIASKIRLPGDWTPAVREFVFGTASKEDSLLPVSNKKITASFANDHVALKIYGDVTTNDLVETAPMIRDFVKDQRNKTVNHKGLEKLKPELMKTMLIYYLVKGKNMSNQEVIDYCKVNKVRYGMKKADVGRYVRLANEQIEKIYT